RAGGLEHEGSQRCRPGCVGCRGLRALLGAELGLQRCPCCPHLGGTSSFLEGERGRDGQVGEGAVCCPPQLGQWSGEVREQAGTALRLPPAGQVGLEHRWADRMWELEHRGQTERSALQTLAIWPYLQHRRHWANLLPELAGSTLLGWE